MIVPIFSSDKNHGCTCKLYFVSTPIQKCYPPCGSTVGGPEYLDHVSVILFPVQHWFVVLSNCSWVPVLDFCVYFIYALNQLSDSVLVLLKKEGALQWWLYGELLVLDNLLFSYICHIYGRGLIGQFQLCYYFINNGCSSIVIHNVNIVLKWLVIIGHRGILVMPVCVHAIIEMLYCMR